MTLDRILNVTVTRETRTPSRQGFGTMLLAASHEQGGSDVQEFQSLAAAEGAGFTAANEPYVNRQLTTGFAQNPSPTAIKIGKRTNVSAQTVTLTPTSISEGVVYDIGVNGELASYTVQPADTLALVVAGIVSAINGLSGAGADPNATDNAGASLTIAAATVAKRYYLTGIDDCDLNDDTTDGGIATDLAQIVATDADWYGLVIDGYGTAEITGAAAWIETQVRLFVAETSDSDSADSGSTTDTLSALMGSNYARTGGIYKKTDYANGTAAGWMGQGLTEDPMAIRVNQKKTWAHRTIPTVPVDLRLSKPQKDTIESKRGTHYTRYAGLDLTFEGMTAAGEFFDIPQFVDAYVARLQERFVGMFATQDLAFDGETQANLEGNMIAITNQAIEARQIATDPAPIYTVPAPLEVPVADRAARRWTGLVIEARLSGGVHAADLVINLTV